MMRARWQRLWQKLGALVDVDLSIPGREAAAFCNMLSRANINERTKKWLNVMDWQAFM
jgi:hypothetical protein